MLIILAVILLIIAALFFVPTYVMLEISKEGEKNTFDVKIKYLFFKMKMNAKNSPGKKSEKKEDRKEKTEEKEELPVLKKIEKGIEIYKYIEDDVEDILSYASEKALTIREITFSMDFGLSDAMYTGIVTGSAYATAYNIIALLNNIFTVEKCDVKINPDFEKKHLDIYSKCILKVKNVHIMIIVFKVLKMYFKITKIK